MKKTTIFLTTHYLEEAEFCNNILLIDAGKLIAEGNSKELKTKSSLLGLENNIEFIGEVPNDLLPQYLAKASIFVRPSLSEGLGIAFLEAMAVGLPVIGTLVGGIPDFLKDSETGLFCKVSDPKDLAEKIVRILKDEQLREKIVINARALIVQKYDWNIIANKLSQIYGRI